MTRVRRHPLKTRRGITVRRDHFRNVREEDQRHFETLREANEGPGGEQLRKLMRDVAAEIGSPRGGATAEITTTSDGFTQLTIMDPRTGYFRSFHIGCRGPAEQIAHLINSGQRVVLPDRQVIEAAD